MTNEDFKALQTQTIGKVVTILEKNSNVLACLLVGSSATGKNDVFSDIDIICFLTSEEKVGREELCNQVGEIYSYVSKLYLYDKFALYLYDNGLRLDLDFYKPSEVKPIDAGRMKILYDPKGFLGKNVKKGTVIEKSPPPTWHDNEGDFVEWFLWMFRQIYCFCRRAEEGTNTSFDKLLGAYNSLVEVRNKLLDVKRFLMEKRNYIKTDDLQFAERMSKTFPEFDAGSMIQANELLLSEFEVLLPQYYQNIHKTYPQEKVLKLKEVLRTFANL